VGGEGRGGKKIHSSIYLKYDVGEMGGRGRREV
jgi:hypothetical protein